MKDITWHLMISTLQHIRANALSYLKHPDIIPLPIYTLLDLVVSTLYIMVNLMIFCLLRLILLRFLLEIKLPFVRFSTGVAGQAHHDFLLE